MDRARPRSIVSGGQSGADRGALDAAIELGIPHDGWCPRGRLAEDGPIPVRYQLRETDSAEYPVRTERNVLDSDATVVITRGPPRGGSRLTSRLARRHGRPLLEIDLERLDLEAAAAALAGFVGRERVQILNVAGPRASGDPEIEARVRALLLRAFAPAL